MRRTLTSTALALVIAAAAGIAACQGCQPPPPPPHVAVAADGKPTVRLYLVSTIAGAMEPCGCTKDQLGGVDHLAAYVEGQKAEAPRSLVLGAGPMLFLDPKLKPDAKAQDEWKAEALATAVVSNALRGGATLVVVAHHEHLRADLVRRLGRAERLRAEPIAWPLFAVLHELRPRVAQDAKEVAAVAKNKYRLLVRRFDRKCKAEVVASVQIHAAK